MGYVKKFWPQSFVIFRGNISNVITTKANKHNGHETDLANFIGGSRKANSTDIKIQSIICSNESLVVSGDCALSIKPALAAILMGKSNL